MPGHLNIDNVLVSFELFHYTKNLKQTGVYGSKVRYVKGARTTYCVVFSRGYNA